MFRLQLNMEAIVAYKAQKSDKYLLSHSPGGRAACGGARMSHFPVRHISVRVPWHDAGWAGTVCDAPYLNGACVKLTRIAVGKQKVKEISWAGSGAGCRDVARAYTQLSKESYASPAENPPH